MCLKKNNNLYLMQGKMTILPWVGATIASLLVQTKLISFHYSSLSSWMPRVHKQIEESANFKEAIDVFLATFLGALGGRFVEITSEISYPCAVVLLATYTLKCFPQIKAKVNDVFQSNFHTQSVDTSTIHEDDFDHDDHDSLSSETLESHAKNELRFRNASSE